MTYFKYNSILFLFFEYPQCNKRINFKRNLLCQNFCSRLHALINQTSPVFYPVFELLFSLCLEDDQEIKNNCYDCLWMTDFKQNYVVAYPCDQISN